MTVYGSVGKQVDSGEVPPLVDGDIHDLDRIHSLKVITKAILFTSCVSMKTPKQFNSLVMNYSK